MQIKHGFSSFSVNDEAKVKDFYTNILGLELSKDQMGSTLKLPDGGKVFIYSKDTHEPATFTVLNLVVDDIDKAVEELEAKGVTFERYDSMPAPQDEKGILRGLSAEQGPDIAWFKDPFGNILSIIQDS